MSYSEDDSLFLKIQEIRSALQIFKKEKSPQNTEILLQSVADQLKPEYYSAKDKWRSMMLLENTYDIVVTKQNHDVDASFVKIFRIRQAELELEETQLFAKKLTKMTATLNLRLPGDKRHIFY